MERQLQVRHRRPAPRAGHGRRFRLALALALTATAAIAGSPGAEEPPSPPSVLLVTLDTTRADHLGCYGAELAATPRLDALAASGTRFERALSPSPLTLPSHASLFTGQVPRRHGVRNNALFRLGPQPAVIAERFRDAGYQTAAFVSSMVLDRIVGLDRGFELYDDSVRVGPREAFNHEERAAIQTNEVLFARLDELEPPFFLWVHYFDPHLPYVPPEPYRARFADRPYDGEIAFMDAQLGALLQAVRKRAGELIVAVAGDHGESLGDHGEEAHGIFVYDSTQRVPLILAGTGVPEGRVVTRTVGLVDVAPTLLELTGLPPLPDADGLSLVPLLAGATELAPRSYELEALFPYFAYGWSPLRALAGDRYKYVAAPRDELYDLRRDPGERRNLADAQRERADDLSAELRRRAGDDVVGPVQEGPELAEQRRRLEALGYVGGGPADESPQIDPKEGVRWIADLEAGRRAYQTGRPQAGLEPLERLLQRNPRNVPALLALAMCHLGMERPELAVEADRRALEIRPDDELVHFNLANALAALAARRTENRTELRGKARAHYERALELNPRFPDAYLNYAAFLEGAGADSGALALLLRAREAGVRDPAVETRIAVLRLKRGDVESAKEAFRAALELNPRDAGPLEALGRILERQGNTADALVYYRRLLQQLPPGDPSRDGLSRQIEALAATPAGQQAGD
jgi:arylsulfatase A-like enzyme/Flp pilus assembly protein TadD